MIQVGKIVNSNQFNERYVALTDADKNAFSVVCNKLLNNNFIYGQTGYDEDTYRTIRRLKDVIESYFHMIDYALVHDDNYRIYFLKSLNKRSKIKLRKLETVLTLVCAKLYATRSLDPTSGNGIEIIVSYDELIDEVNKTRIYRKNKLYKTEVFNALRMLNKYMIIDTNNKSENTIDTFKILPTILYVVTDENLSNIDERLKGLSLDNTEEGVIEDETDED